MTSFVLTERCASRGEEEDEIKAIPPLQFAFSPLCARFCKVPT